VTRNCRVWPATVKLICWTNNANLFLQTSVSKKHASLISLLIRNCRVHCTWHVECKYIVEMQEFAQSPLFEGINMCKSSRYSKVCFLTIFFVVRFYEVIGFICNNYCLNVFFLKRCMCKTQMLIYTFNLVRGWTLTGSSPRGWGTH